MKKRFLRNWDVTPKPAAQPAASNASPPSPLSPTTLPSLPPLPEQKPATALPSRRRRYPKLLSTDPQGNLIPHPLSLAAQATAPRPSSSSASHDRPVATAKRPAAASTDHPPKRKPGRPPGSKNKPKPPGMQKPSKAGRGKFATKNRQYIPSPLSKSAVRAPPPSRFPRPSPRSQVMPVRNSSGAAGPYSGAYARGTAPSNVAMLPDFDMAGGSDMPPSAQPTMAPRVQQEPPPQYDAPACMDIGDDDMSDDAPLSHFAGRPTGFSHDVLPAQFHGAPREYSRPLPASQLEDAVNSHFPPDTPPAMGPNRPSSAEDKAAEKVIQVGRRCGTVQYWRSSLQMPKRSGVKKPISKKAASTLKKHLKSLCEEDAAAINSSTLNKHLNPLSEEEAAVVTSTPAVKAISRPAQPAKSSSFSPSPTQVPSPPFSSGPDSRPQASAPPPPVATPTTIVSASLPAPASTRPSLFRHSVIPTDRGLVNPHATRTPLDTGQQHAFWRSATKLPSVSSDKARMKRLANGKRKNEGAPRVNTSARPRYPQSEVLDQSLFHLAKAPESGRRSPGPSVFSEPPQYDGTPPREHLPPADMADADRIGTKAPTPEVQKTPQMVIDEEQTEMRRLHMTKDYEIRKLESYAESRYHVKMNLRGRHKLEKWLATSDDIAANSVLFIVLVLNLDRRLVSRSARERQDALEDMDNEHLRMLEALMARTSTRDGHTNWGLLTANFNVERIETS